LAKTISTEFLAHLAGEVTTVCSASKITRRDGQVYYFVDLDTDLTIESNLHHSQFGFTRTAKTTDTSLTVDNLEVTGLFDAAGVTEADLRSGKFDFCEIRTYLVNYEKLSQGKLALGRSYLGEAKSMPWGVFSAELRGLTQRFVVNIGEQCTSECRADLGDSRCTFDLGPVTKTGVITSTPEDNRSFGFNLDDPSNVTNNYINGVVTWLSGQNSGRAMEVKDHIVFPEGPAIGLFLPMPMPITVGDTFTVYPGCDKRITTCRDKFNNVVNFVGEPDVPTAGTIVAVTNAQAFGAYQSTAITGADIAPGGASETAVDTWADTSTAASGGGGSDHG
jgi:uncharacterized phage protein (TIGR02218 family)